MSDAGIGNSHSDHGKVILGVRDITDSSAMFDWSVPEDRPILEFKVREDYYKGSFGFALCASVITDNDYDII